MSDPTPVASQRTRAERAWAAHANWDHLYQDAYDFAIPFRKQGGASKSKQIADRLFDMTAPNSAMHMAGALQRLLFGTAPVLTPGALVRQALNLQGPQGVRDLQKLERELEKTGEFIYPFMSAGDLDTATHEACIDLGFGTAVIIPMRGTADQPIIFHTPPADEVAFTCDAYGRVTLASWRRYVTREALVDAVPDGNFTQAFKDAAKANPNAEVLFYQDFFKLPDGRWRFCSYTDRDCPDFISTETYRTKPLATPRYYRVAGENRGRGPILLALPSIKTVNKAQELALKSAAIQMLGIWGYRAGSGFNPDTVSQAPGSFWAMKSTGGALGPDVTRLDPASGRLDIASMVIEGMQQQIRDSLMDTRLQPVTGTPRSASEIAGLLQQSAQVHLGGFMRLWREGPPEIVPRCAEILNSFGYLGGLMDFNQLIVSVGVRSPMAAAINADKVANIARYAELMTSLVGLQKLPEHLMVDDAADAIAAGMMVPNQMVPDAEQRASIRQTLDAQMQQQIMGDVAAKAAPQVAGGMLKLIQGGADQTAAAA